VWKIFCSRASSRTWQIISWVLAVMGADGSFAHSRASHDTISFFDLCADWFHLCTKDDGLRSPSFSFVF
jgi:hypothetical protein